AMLALISTPVKRALARWCRCLAKDSQSMPPSRSKGEIAPLITPVGFHVIARTPPDHSVGVRCVGSAVCGHRPSSGGCHGNGCGYDVEHSTQSATPEWG